MHATSDQDSSTPLAPPTDSGLRCPTCDYNLTGTIESRCPECGKPFDLEELRAILAGAPAPIPIWDDKERNIIARFIHICLLTWLAPWKFARIFPRHHRPQSARQFRRLIMLVAFCVTAVSITLSVMLGIARKEDWFVPLLFFVGLWPGAAICEAFLGSCLIASIAQKVSLMQPPDSSIDYGWPGLVGFFRTFIILSISMTCLLSTIQILSFLLVVALFGLFIWWWAAISSAIAVQPASLAEKICTILLIPVFAGFSSIVGGVIAWILMMLLSDALHLVGFR